MDGWDKAPMFGRPPAAGGAGCVVRPSAYGLVEDGQGRVAIVRTSAGVYLPGGGVERSETAAEAVRREVLEECGLIVRTGRWEARAIQFVYSPSEETHFEKRSTFIEAVATPGASRAGEVDHQLEWVGGLTAARVLSHESHRWAVALWMRRPMSGH